MTEASITTPHHMLQAYLATPAGSGPWPGVIVLHDALGMTEVARGHADWFASEGFVAVAPDLYSWGRKLRCIRATMTDIQSRKGAAFDDVDAVKQWLGARAECSGKIGVIGFCMTGGFAILLASGHGFSASSANYGAVPNDIDAILEGACPVVGSFGKKDVTLKGAAARLETALAKRQITHDVKEYTEAGHSFLEPHKGLLFGVLGLLGTGYNETAATDAKARIAGFFKRHLA
jgi:carboxymethylenebutenolidase